MGTPGPDFKPCGACGKLVDAASGCAHWKPDGKVGKRVGWVRGPAKAKPMPAASPEADLAFMRVLDRGVSQAIQ